MVWKVALSGQKIMDLLPFAKSYWPVFQACPWKAHAIKNLRFRDESGPAAILGVEIHDWLCRYFLGQTSLEEILDSVSSDEARSMIQLGVAAPPFNTGLPRDCETHVMIDTRGHQHESYGSSIAHGYLDILVTDEDRKELVIADWKTGRWQKWDQVESHLYGGVFGRALMPDAKRVTFKLFFLRTGTTLKTTYEWETKHTCVVTPPDGKTFRMHDTKGPLLQWLKTLLLQIRRTAPEPRPGDHCHKWFGRPCSFLTTICPLNESLPSLEKVEGKLWNPIKDFLDGLADPYSIKPKAIEGAFEASRRLRALAHEVESKAATHAIAMDLKIGNDVYGWRVAQETLVDKSFTLQSLFESGMSYEEMARLVEFPDPKQLPEGIRLLGVTTTTGDPIFGRITPLTTGDGCPGSKHDQEGIDG